MLHKLLLSHCMKSANRSRVMINEALLAKDVQRFIYTHENDDVHKLILQTKSFKECDIKEVATQITSRKKTKQKLPKWYTTKNIIYPNPVSIEQSSSEATAQFKASVVNGDSLIDITGGFGVDSYYFSEKITHVTHVEINPSLSAIAKHNFSQLSNKENIHFIAQDGVEYLKNSPKIYDWVYADPSRRHATKGKVFKLEDYQPNIDAILKLLGSKTKAILLKTSPLVDIKLGISVLKKVSKLYVVALKNEVKELLWVLEDNTPLPINEVPISCINLGTKQPVYTNTIGSEQLTENNYGTLTGFLYEPNAAILKAGFFKSIATHYQLQKVARHSHLYISAKKIDFPGRHFKISSCIPFNKKNLKAIPFKKANISAKNFPISVAEIRKKGNIKDGGKEYLFFTSDNAEKKIILVCTKL